MQYPQRNPPPSFETQVPVRERGRFGAPSYWVYARLLARRVRPIPIQLLVDTGSPWTVLSPRDWKLLGLIPRTLSKAKEYLRIGYAGHSFERRIMANAKLRFRNRMGNIIAVSIPELSVIVAIGKIPKKNEDRIDSILGMDVSTPPIFDDKAKEWFIILREHIEIEI